MWWIGGVLHHSGYRYLHPFFKLPIYPNVSFQGAVSHLHPDVAEVLRDNGAHVKIGLKGKSLASGTSLVARAEVIEKMKADFNSLSLPGERDRVKVDVFKKMLKVRHGLTCSNHPLLKTQVEMITDEDGYITWDSYLKVLEREGEPTFTTTTSIAN